MRDFSNTAGGPAGFPSDPEVTLVSSEGSEAEPTHGTIERRTENFRLEFSDMTFQMAAAPVQRQIRINLRRIPASVERFVQRVAKISGVQCIVAEEAEHQVVHITTFAAPITEALRREVYDVEMDTIDENPATRFDFHLRRADEAHGTPPATQYFFAIWGAIDASDG